MDLREYLNKKHAEFGIGGVGRFDKDRVHRIYEKLKPHINLKCRKIQILGTNGKGSTGRFLALMLLKHNKSVFHFTSPHLLDFTERFYKNGGIAKHQQSAHEFLQNFDFVNEASYFEYVTFVALILSQDVDFLVMEAGLGGEFDATSCIDYDLSIFTSIDFDHMDLLGFDIKSIATTKLKAMSKLAILSPQNHKETVEIAKSIANFKGTKLHILEAKLEGRGLNISTDQNSTISARFLRQNKAVADFAISLLGLDPVNVNLDLPGRFWRFKSNVIIDVGHNVSAARVVLEEMQRHCEGKFNLIYNSYQNKDVRQILELFAPFVNKVLILEVGLVPRIIAKDQLCEILQDLGLEYEDFVDFDEKQTYLAFGSFKVAEELIKRYG